ncbi:MAG: glycosyltransferase, partial [Leptolinea sp.]
MIVVTSICANYLPKAKTLAMSVKNCLPETRFVVCLVEQEIHTYALDVPQFDGIILARDIGFVDFQKFIFRHSIVEASTAVKAQLFRYLLEKYPEEDNFVYLDPDIFVYSNFDELQEELILHPIILCPHVLEPGNIKMELSSLQHGTFNLGFLAIRRSEEANKFLDWWAERLYWYCYDDIP